MKRCSRLLALIVAAFVFLPAPVAWAEGEDQEFGRYGKGTVQTGHPGSAVIGVTEAEFRVSKCSTLLASQGVDALVMEIGTSAYFSVKAHLLGVTDPQWTATYTGLFSNQSFYSSSCRWLSTAYMRANKSPTLVPEGARWAVVAFPYGGRIGMEWKAGATSSECSFY